MKCKVCQDDLQLAMLRGQVCSSKGKRARNMGQEQIKDTLECNNMAMIQVGERRENENYGT